MSLIRRTFFIRSLAKFGALLALVLAPLALVAQEAPKRELTEKVAEKIQPIAKKIMEAPHDYDGALQEINELLASVRPDSYDTAQLSQLKAQAFIGKNDYASSVGPIETAYRLSRTYKFFEPAQELGLLWMLAQLYVQDAGRETNLELQKQKFAKALATVREWLSLTPKPTFEAYYFAATILYQQAQPEAGSGKEADKELLKQAEAECHNALTMSIKPRNEIYQLLVAIAQANNQPEVAAQYLELMVAANPKNSSFWTMLLSSYLTAAETMPEGSYMRNDVYAKAVYTIERAQKNGFMNTPVDYQRLIACYFNSSQFEGTVDVLEAGLRNGKVENDQKNWELLSSCYLQLNRTQKAIDTLVEASKIFPDKGDLDMQIGYLYYGNEQYRKALDYMKVARDKGVAENKTASLLFFIGYLHYELKELDEALESVEKSLAIKPDDTNAKGVSNAIKEAIQERERALNKNQPAPAPKPGEENKQSQAKVAAPAAQPAK